MWLFRNPNYFFFSFYFFFIFLLCLFRFLVIWYTAKSTNILYAKRGPTSFGLTPVMDLRIRSCPQGAQRNRKKHSYLKKFTSPFHNSLQKSSVNVQWILVGNYEMHVLSDFSGTPACITQEQIQPKACFHGKTKIIIVLPPPPRIPHAYHKTMSLETREDWLGVCELFHMSARAISRWTWFDFSRSYLNNYWSQQQQLLFKMIFSLRESV